MDFKITKYLDFHTHQLRNDSNIFEIKSLHFDKSTDLKSINSPFTIGRHPWFTKNELTSSEKLYFKEISSHKLCLGIGEIGLDKLNGLDLKTQNKHFKTMLELASSVNKPVVIHCVKAYDELLKVKKEFPEIKKWCIHGFNKNLQLAEQLVKNEFFLSLNATKKTSTNYSKIIKNIPVDYLFLETDDTTIKIEKLYTQFSEIKNCDTNQLKHKLHKNYLKFFDIKTD